MVHGWTHDIMPLEENPKLVDKRIRCNPMSHLKFDMWHERTSPLDPSSPNRIGWVKEREIEREKKEERERMGFLEIEALPSLLISWRSDIRFPTRQEAKLLPTARATRGYRFCEVLKTLGGRDFLLLDLILV